MAKRLIVHVGPGKTGTTAIQAALRRSRGALVERGVAYWGMTLDFAPIQAYPWQHIRPPEQLFSRTAQEKNFTGEFVDVVVRSLASGPQTAIVSNDSFTTYYERLIPLLRAVESEGVDLLVVSYVRAPSTYAQSAFAQWELKTKHHRGRIRPFHATRGHFVRRFADKLEAFDRAFGHRFQLRNYDAAGDVVADFLRVIGVDVNLRRLQANVRPSPEEELLRAFYNDRQPGRASAAAFEDFAPPKHVDFGLDLMSWYCTLLPTQDDVDAAAAALKDDLGRLNELLSARDQPLLADPGQLSSSGAIETDRLLGLLVQIQYSQHVRLSALESKSGSKRRVLERVWRTLRRAIGERG